MSFLSTEEVIEALDRNEPAMGSEVDGLSLCSFEDEPHAAVSREEDQSSTTSELPSQENEQEQFYAACVDPGPKEAEQAYTTSEEPSQEEDGQPHTASEDPGQEGESSARQGPSGGGMYTSSEESSQEESSQDVDSNNEEAPKKKATRKRKLLIMLFTMILNLQQVPTVELKRRTKRTLKTMYHWLMFIVLICFNLICTQTPLLMFINVVTLSMIFCMRTFVT